MKGKKFCLKNNENTNILPYFRYLLKVVNKIISKTGELRILPTISLLICAYISFYSQGKENNTTKY